VFYCSKLSKEVFHWQINPHLVKINKHIINSEFSRFQSVTVKGHFSYHLALLSLPSYTPLEVCKAHKGKISQHLL